MPPLFVLAAWRFGTSPLGRLLLLTLVVAGVLLAVRHASERAGAARITAKVEKAHAIAVAEAQRDTSTAANASTAIATSVAQQAVASAAVTHYIVEDLTHAIDAVPPTPTGAPLPAVPVDGLRDDLNTAIARADRAADAADALP